MLFGRDCCQANGSGPATPEAQLSKQDMPHQCEQLGGCEMTTELECCRCGRWLCGRCGMDGTPPADIATQIAGGRLSQMGAPEAAARSSTQ